MGTTLHDIQADFANYVRSPEDLMAVVQVLRLRAVGAADANYKADAFASSAWWRDAEQVLHDAEDTIRANLESQKVGARR